MKRWRPSGSATSSHGGRRPSPAASSSTCWATCPSSASASTTSSSGARMRTWAIRAGCSCSGRRNLSRCRWGCWREPQRRRGPLCPSCSDGDRRRMRRPRRTSQPLRRATRRAGRGSSVCICPPRSRSSRCPSSCASHPSATGGPHQRMCCCSVLQSRFSSAPTCSSGCQIGPYLPTTKRCASSWSVTGGASRNCCAASLVTRCSARSCGSRVPPRRSSGRRVSGTGLPSPRSLALSSSAALARLALASQHTRCEGYGRAESRTG